MQDPLASTSPATLEEEFTLPFCECGHLLSEHGLGKCYALFLEGCWKACLCDKTRPAIFKFSFEEEEFLC